MTIQLEFFSEGAAGSETWNILQDGEPIEFIILVDRGETLSVAYITDTVGRLKGLPLGISGVRGVLAELRKEFPRATQISGLRISGIRISSPIEEQRVRRKI